MNAGIAAYVILTQNTDVTDIVGVKVFPEVAEQETATPFIVYQLQSVAPEDTHDGPSKLDEVRFEFLCYADTYALAADLGDKVRGALDRVSGTYNGVNVESVQFNDVDIDTIDAPRRFAQVLTFTFRIKRDDFEIAQGTPVTGAKIGDLYDVDVTGVTDGQVLAYDAAVQEWQPADDAGGVTELGQLTDVQFGQGGPETGELLKYDGSEWTNDSLVKSEVGLGNVDNTSDADKPVSTATQTALSAKANSADFSNVDNTSDADKPVSTATQTALNAKADTSAVPTDLNDLSDVTIVGTPSANQALIYDATANAFKSQVSYTNRFEDEVETGKDMPTIFAERAYSVKSEGDGIFIDAESDTPAAGKVIVRKIYHKTGFITDADVIGDYTLIHTFADNTAYADTVATFDGFEDGATYGVPPFTLLQTWEEVTAAPAFTGLLNETYGSGAEAAYSTRRLNGNVTDCMVIRRASDSTTTTIGFDGSGNIDESAINTFCTGTTCTVYQWLDQSGNGNTATAPSTGAEPTIYTGGALVKENGKLALEFFNDRLDALFSSKTLTTQSSFSVASIVIGSRYDRLFTQMLGANTDVPSYIPMVRDNLNNVISSYVGSFVSPLTFTYGTPFLFNSIHSGSTLTNYLNGSSGASVNNTLSETIDRYVIGARPDAIDNELNGTVQELIIYDSDKSGTDQTSIEENIGDYFTQNTPLLDTYTGAAACYSLRLMRTAYTGDAVEVYNGSSYADIGFNVFGELDTVALAAHCGSNDGFVSKWYDQAGSNDAAQTTTANMPKIYDGTTGVVTDTQNKPVLSFSGGQQLLTGTMTAASQPVTAISFVDTTNSPAQAGWFYSLGQSQYAAIQDNGSQTRMYAGSSFVSGGGGANTRRLDFSLFDGANSEIYLNSVSRLTGNPGTNGITSFRIGGLNNSNFNGFFGELIAYPSDQSSNRTNIEDNINTFYSIY